MESKGTVVNGVVVLEEGVSIPEGAKVIVILEQDEDERLRQGLLRFAGKARDLPEDLAENHDYYLHSRQP
jgi:excinuclease UvrABC helicase subunit UvrB